MLLLVARISLEIVWCPSNGERLNRKEQNQRQISIFVRQGTHDVNIKKEESREKVEESTLKGTSNVLESVVIQQQTAFQCRILYTSK